MNGSVLFTLFLSLIFCLPPFMALRLFARSYKRAERRNLPSRKYLIAMSLALGAFVFNLGALLHTSYLLASDTFAFGRVHAVAAAFAWICFWVWLFLGFALGRDLGRRSGLR